MHVHQSDPDFLAGFESEPQAQDVLHRIGIQADVQDCCFLYRGDGRLDDDHWTLALGDRDGVAVRILAVGQRIPDGQADQVGAGAAVLVRGINLRGGIAIPEVPEEIQVVAQGGMGNDEGRLSGRVRRYCERGLAAGIAICLQLVADDAAATVKGQNVEAYSVEAALRVVVAGVLLRGGRPVSEVPEPVGNGGGGGTALVRKGDRIAAVGPGEVGVALGEAASAGLDWLAIGAGAAVLGRDREAYGVETASIVGMQGVLGGRGRPVAKVPEP